MQGPSRGEMIFPLALSLMSDSLYPGPLEKAMYGPRYMSRSATARRRPNRKKAKARRKNRQARHSRKRNRR